MEESIVKSNASLEELSNNSGDFWIQTVPTLEAPSQLRFAIDAYAAYHPVVVTGILNHWPALSKWDKNYLTTVVRNKVGINLTPDGHGDCVKNIGDRKQFVYPAEVSVKMSTFFHLLENEQPGAAVPYLSQQNDNLRTDMECLMSDIDPSLPLVDEVFGGCAPEAVNLWIGDERSVSSIHKDHYENMYAVIQGEKCFTLFPPTDIAFFPEDTFPTSRYVLREEAQAVLREFDVSSQPLPSSSISSSSSYNDIGSRLNLTGDDLSLVNNSNGNNLSWLPFDPEDSSASLLADHPQLRHSHPIRVRVQAGQVLYIPAMWYHRVSQSQFTIAVNYWYDQRFDHRYSLAYHLRNGSIMLSSYFFLVWCMNRYVFFQLAKSLQLNRSSSHEEDRSTSASTAIIDR